jgi:hypothetical protein
MKWSPPARPDWVTNLLAHGDALGGSEGLIPLEAEPLIGRARAMTGLDDFGPEDDWKPHLEILLDALARESHLHLAGRIVTGTEILRSLQNRLRMTDLWKREPERLETPIEAPVFVVGSARSGTSITHELLACDPGNRVPLLWEMLQPFEASTGQNRLEVADRTMRFWHQLQPEYETMHFNAGDLPNECIYLFMQNFVSDQFMGCHEVPSYAAHLQALDQTFVYREHKRLLQSLESGTRGPRWILKAPSHLPLLRFLFRVYPDARIILTHRDPTRTLASGLSLLGTLKWMRCERVDLTPMVGAMAAGQAFIWQDVIDARQSGELPDAQFTDVLYDDLMHDPGATIGRVYEALDRRIPDALPARIRDYVERKPKGSHGGHRYDLETFGLDPEEERRRFAFYRERFGVPEEQPLR